MKLSKLSLKSVIIFIFLVIFIFLLILLILKNKNQETKTTPTQTPTPTTFIPQLSPTESEEETPTLIPITGQTGVKEEVFPSITQSLINQKQALRQTLPLIDKDFRIDFDYNEDQFTVILNEPKEKTRTIFTTWLQRNYPAIPIDRFIIN